MKRTLLFLIFAGVAIPASAQDCASTCCEGTGQVRNWPGVVKARYEASLCHGQLMALIARQQTALTYQNPSVLFLPYNRVSTTVVTTSPAPTPPPVVAPSAIPIQPTATKRD